MEEPKEKKLLQWHPGFYAGLQIELEEDADNLEFQNEYQIGTKPKEIDVLIVKKNMENPVHKNIGRIFRKHNIIEYKSPGDYISIDDYYKVYGYACFYKSQTAKIDEIKIEEITVSFVCEYKPAKLIRHLKEQGCRIKNVEPGIYHIEGMRIPIQLILTSQLSKDENLWLGNLTKNLKERETAEKLVLEYGKHEKDPRYQAVMNLIVEANQEVFSKEDEKMCEALRKIMSDELEERENIGRTEGRIEGRVEGRAEGIIETGMEIGLSEEDILGKLQKKLDVSLQKAQEYLHMFGKQMV